MQLMRALTDYENTASLVNRMRSERLRFFEDRIAALGLRCVRILDVGGYEKFWRMRGYRDRTDIDMTILNLERESIQAPNMRSVAGDACHMPQFADGEFDVVFSNSVIEHLHTFDKQQAMASEVRRVGRHHFIQTPNRYFPVEPHYLLPAFQFLPRPVQKTILTRTPLSRGTRMSQADAAAMLDEIRLLSAGEFKALFPTSRIYCERVMGLTKSFTAYSM